MNRTYLRGDMYYADLGRGIGSEQEGYRPVLILQNNTGNKYSPTVIVAAIMGPWVGAISGALYNIISALIGGNILGSLFAICNIGSGLIVGFMARRKKFHTIPHVLVATVLVALWNAIVGSPIAMVVYGGVDGNTGTNLMIAGLQAFGQDLMGAAFLARIPVNLLDKGIACFIAWIILRKLPENMRSLSGGKKAASAEPEKQAEEAK